MTSPDTVTVGPSPFKILGQLTIATVAIAGGAVIVVVLLELLAAAGVLGWASLPPWLWLHHRAIIACLSALFVCYCVIAPLVAAISGRPKVEIGPEGFVDYGVVGRRSRRWSDIEGTFMVIRVGWPLAIGLRPVVAYRLNQTFKESARIKPIASLEGNDEAILICGELAIGAGELADLLNRRKQSARPRRRRHRRRVDVSRRVSMVSASFRQHPFTWREFNP